MSNIIYFPIPIKKFREKSPPKRRKKNNKKFRHDLIIFLLSITFGLILGYLSSFFVGSFENSYTINQADSWQTVFNNPELVFGELWNNFSTQINLANIWFCLYSLLSFILIFLVFCVETYHPKSFSKTTIRLVIIYSLYFVFFAKGMQIQNQTFDPAAFFGVNLVAMVVIIQLAIDHYQTNNS